MLSLLHTNDSCQYYPQGLGLRPVLGASRLSELAAAIDRYTMFGSGGIRLGVNRARQVGVRRMGGWIRTNMRTEENAGLREASYKTWEFDTTSVPRLLVYMFIPGALFFFVARDEMVSGHASSCSLAVIVILCKGHSLTSIFTLCSSVFVWFWSVFAF